MNRFNKFPGIPALGRSGFASSLGGLLKWIVLGGVVGILAGSASALFLNSLAYVTGLRLDHPWLLFLLPLGGALISWLYLKYGKTSGRGNNLILEQIHGTDPAPIPLRMAPLVLFGTLTSHLLGASVGREGTAVQMGGSLADAFGRLIRIAPADRQILLICGISGGFGSIFGTPLAGTLFGLEVLAIGLVRYEALIPAFVASFAGNLVTSSFWGVTHAHYAIDSVPALSAAIVWKVVLASILFGLMGMAFSETTHAFKRLYARLFKNPVFRSAVGGVVVIALVYLLGTREYLGLGLPLIEASLTGDVSPFAFVGKFLFTTLSLGAGFQGGEVTPLFAIGATLGHSLAAVLQVHAPFLAALGFIAVFCGATHTPIACFLMGIELFGADAAVYLFIACLISYGFSGHSGIYTSQRIGVSKYRGRVFPVGTTLESAKTIRQKDRREAAVPLDLPTKSDDD